LLDCGVAGQPASWNIIDTSTWGRCGAWLLVAPELNCHFLMIDWTSTCPSIICSDVDSSMTASM
jgi:hypothetical protein